MIKNILPLSIKILFLISTFIYMTQLSSQTLADIKDRVGKNRISAVKPVTMRKKQNKFEIHSVRPGNIKGYKVKTDNGGYVNLHGVEITFKINERGNDFHIPYAFCYFYDKKKNLLDRQTVDFVYHKNSTSPKPLENELTIDGKRSSRVVCSYPANFSFKYAVVLLGDKDHIDVMCYPKSSDYNDFDFDEKEMLKNLK